MTAPITQSSSLTKWQKWLLATTIVGFAPLAAISFWGSYSALQAEAIRRDFAPDQAWVVPIGVDAGIIGLSVWDLLLTSLRKPWPLLRRLVVLLTGATIWFNAAAGHDAVGMGMHGVLPLLFIIYIKAFRYLLMRRSATDVIGVAYEGIPWSRWFWAPWSTLLMKRRMALWGESDYERAIGTEQATRRAYAQLKQRFGRTWKAKTPDDVRWMLRTGVHVQEACDRVAELTGTASVEPRPPLPARTAAPVTAPALATGSVTPAAAPPAAGTADVHTAGTADPAPAMSDPVPSPVPSPTPRPARRPAGKGRPAATKKAVRPRKTFLEVAEPHYLECLATGTAFDIAALRNRHGGSDSTWRTVRKQLVERHGAIDEADDRSRRPIPLQHKGEQPAAGMSRRSA